MLTRRSIMAGALGAPLLAPGHVFADAEAQASPTPTPTPPTVDELLRPGLLNDAAISPDGRRIVVAGAVRDPEAEAEAKVRKPRRYEIVVEDDPDSYVLIRDAEALDDPPQRFKLPGCTVEMVEWANNERLLIWIAISKLEGRVLGYDFYGITIPVPMRRVIAVDVDGGNRRVLFENEAKMLKRSFNAARVIDLLPGDDRRVMMQMYDHRREAETLFLVDVYTGAAELLERGTTSTATWQSQDGVPVLRYAYNRRGTVMTIEGRPPGEADWKLVRKVRHDEWSRKDFDVVGFSDQPGVLLVVTHEPGAETNALRTFDLKTLSYGAVLAQRPDRDIEGVFVDEHRAYLGAGYIRDTFTYEFADRTLAPHYRGIQKFLGDESCVAITDISRDRNRFLVAVSGPREPGARYFYDRKAARLEALGSTRPWLTADRLGRCETLSVKTRDGAAITAYLTRPLATGKRPLVVMPHGGPELRDHMDFDLFAQALAAQGWLVLQPNFRGSGGYGRSFADAGRKRWGDRMQQDVEDAVAHVLAMGVADPAKIAICGASYGGYAALMGPILRPDLYRRAVAIAGVFDLPDLLRHEKDEEGADSPTYAYFLRTIGDPKADAAMLVAASPRRRAAELTLPVLLIHGDQDERAPYVQSKDMAAALARAGKTHHFETLRGAGHGGWSVEDWKKILGLTTDFLSEGFDER